jgi:hypothetical protein
MPIAALVIVGILLVVLGLFAGGVFWLVVLGVVALIAAGALEVMARQRR